MRKKEKKKKLNYKFLIISLVILIIAFTAFFAALIRVIDYFTIIEQKKIYASLTVDDHYGFNLNPPNLTFGMLMPGSSAKRDLIIENKYNFSIRVKIIPKQDMEKFIEIQEQVIPKNKTEKITILAYVPADTLYGNYSGEVVVIVRKN